MNCEQDRGCEEVQLLGNDPERSTNFPGMQWEAMRGMHMTVPPPIGGLIRKSVASETGGTASEALGYGGVRSGRMPSSAPGVPAR